MQNGQKPTQKKTHANKSASNCETCVYYDYDDFTETYCCRNNLDEDDMYRFITRDTASCPYYHFYDEYKSVQKQN